ncbi:MAG: ribbon-helix-helix protein, CopG family [Deltaproteobacteria bacterium]|nr:ribbon-helix-helix protein, CopG family [Deltaproteobacteria bacterium]
MSPVPKTKISITLARDLLEVIDRRVAAGAGRSRSAVIEAWLRRAAHRDAEAILARETIAYYESRTAEERAEDETWSRLSSDEFARLDDEPRAGRRRRR